MYVYVYVCVHMYVRIPRDVFSSLTLHTTSSLKQIKFNYISFLLDLSIRFSNLKSAIYKYE